MSSKLLIFDDAGGRWGPMVDLRPVFELRTGAVTNQARIERWLDRPASVLWVTDAMVAATNHRHNRNQQSSQASTNQQSAALQKPAPQGSQVFVNELPDFDDFLLVNGRLMNKAICKRAQTLELGAHLVTSENELLICRVNRTAALALIEHGFLPANDAHIEHVTADQRPLIARPWHIFDSLNEALLDDLAKTNVPHCASSTLPSGVSLFGDSPCCIDPTATVRPQVVINTEQGPVVVEAGAVISSFTVLNGPCFIGKQSVINAHANIRPNTVIGPKCKVGGEVSFSIMHGYSNKAHDGYLGHSLVGKWVNLGGGTNVSNLKNNYGNIRTQLLPGDTKDLAQSIAGSDLSSPASNATEDTGCTFLGPVIGDFTLTAIGSRIMTGSCLGTGTMLALSSFAPKFTSAFSFLTDQKSAQYELDRFMKMALAMTSRRCCDMQPVEVDLLRKLHTASTTSDGMGGLKLNPTA